MESLRSLRIFSWTLILLSAGFVNAGSTVPGTANPYLAGQPDGTTANTGDIAPDNSPVQVTSIAIHPGDVLTFVVTGSTNNDPGPSGLTPDGGFAFARGSENGLAGYTSDINSLMGVFLDDSVPAGTAPADFPFSPNDPMFSPQLRQPFFIGDGLTGNGDGSGQLQKFVVPPGATRLFLASADGCCWNNNFGSFDVQVVIDSVSLSCGWAVGGWHQWTNGHYYSVQPIAGSEYSWPIARAQARALTAPNGRPVDLATLTSAAENAFVFSGADCPDYWAIDGAGNNEGPNVGGFQRDKASEPAGSWAWVTGEPWSYTNWTAGEPNNSSGSEDFLTFFGIGSARTGAWNDISSGTGSVVRYYVAESTDDQPCADAPAGLVGWWEANGDTIDAAGGNNGTLQGAVTFVSGKVGQAFRLGGHGDTSGNGDRVRLTNSGALRLQNFTIDGWIRRASASIVTNNGKPGVDGGTFFAFGAGGYGFLIDQATNRLALTRVGVSNVKSEGTITDTAYHHVAVTKTGSQVIFYIDGVSAGSASYDPGFTFTTNPAIGARGDNDVENAFFGDIDELEVVNRALTPSEVFSVFNAGSSGKCQCVPPPAGMVVWLPGDGTSADFSGNNNNGTAVNGATFAAGYVAQAFNFNDGANQYVRVPDAPNLRFGPTTPMSVDLWIYRTSPSQTQHFIGKRVTCGATADGTYQMGLDFVDSPGCGLFFGPAAAPAVCSGTDLPMNTWTHLAATFDGTTQRLYMNGQLIGALVSPLGQPNSAPLLVGNTSESCGNRGTGGLIDEVEIFSRSLSQSEVQSIFTAGNAGRCRSCVTPPSGIVGWYPGDGNATDASSTVNPAVLHGNATFAAGKVGIAFDLDGTDAYVQAPAVAIQDPTTAGSVEAWVYFNQTPAAAGHIMQIIGKGSSCRDFDLQADADNRFRFYIQCGGQVASTTVIQTGVWYHVAGTWDATGLRIYVNGVLENTNGVQNLTREQSNQPLQIGNQPFFGPRLFNGLIDEAVVVNRALTPTEVQDTFNAGSAGNCKQPPTRLRITSLSRPSSGSLVSADLWISGLTEPNLTVRIQSSPDLVTPFSQIGTATAGADGRFRYDVGNPSQLKKRFYRAVYP